MGLLYSSPAARFGCVRVFSRRLGNPLLALLSLFSEDPVYADTGFLAGVG